MNGRRNALVVAFRAAWEKTESALYAATKQKTQMINAAIRIVENNSRKTKLIAMGLSLRHAEQVIETRRHSIAEINVRGTRRSAGIEEAFRAQTSRL
jgi:hypothetical protein